MNFTTKIVVTLLNLFFLCSCTINLAPKNFIYQDVQKEQFAVASLNKILAEGELQGTVSQLTIKRDKTPSLGGYAFIQAEAQANIIIFPGNGMKINEFFEVLERLARIPANVIWFDYRGVGISDRSDRLSIELLSGDSEAVYDLAKKTLPQDLPLLVHGLSMGSLLAVELAKEKPLDGLVLDSAIGSVDLLSERLTPFWAKLFANVVLDEELQALDSSRAIQQYSGPLLILVGSEDEVTPLADATSIYQNSKSDKKTLIVVDAADHGEPLKKEAALLAYSKFLKNLK